MPVQAAQLTARMRTTISRKKKTKKCPVRQPGTVLYNTSPGLLGQHYASVQQAGAAPRQARRHPRLRLVTKYSQNAAATRPLPWPVLRRVRASISNQDMAGCCQSTTPRVDVQASDAAQVLWRRELWQGCCPSAKNGPAPRIWERGRRKR
jgi:hypothetical protein